MQKYLLIALIAFQIQINGQTLEKEIFIIYEEVLNELQSTENITGLENKYDFTFILLLDSTNIELIEKTRYQHVDEFRNYAPGLSLTQQTVGFVTDKREIREIFQDQNSLKRILDCTNTYNSPNIAMTKFRYPIYIKGNQAIFETSGPTWSDTYSAILKNGVFQINWLGGDIE
ncbi:hypothetical protein [Geofilum rubicundum]|uniref:hypothetical protein n=1 Tax=Geofilum rubicundum TaxID=472113 RepID=UPI0007851C16|nr:hypothetical protein [Geofilum rubicundum]